LGYRLNADAEIAALDLLAAAKLLDDWGRDFGRNGEADADAAAGRRQDRIVDADDVAAHVEQRAAGVSAVDARVGLDVAVVGSTSGGAQNRGNDAGGDGAAEPERVTDRDHPVARARLPRVAEFDEREGLVADDLEHREIRGCVRTDQLGRIFGAVGHLYGDLFDRAVAARRADDVVVGDHVAVGRDDEAGAERLALAVLRLGPAAAAEEVLERRAGEGVDVLHLDPLAGGDIDHRRLELGRQVGKAFGRSGTGHGARDAGVVVLGDLRPGG